MYWLNAASEGGMPFAQAISAMNLAFTSNDDLEVERRLQTAVRGGDPAAYLWIGMALGAPKQGGVTAEASTNADHEGFNVRQAAWMLLSCEETPGCFDPSFMMFDFPCPEESAATCDFKAALTSTLRKQLSAEEYEAATRMSDHIGQAIRKRDWESVDVRPGSQAMLVQ